MPLLFILFQLLFAQGQLVDTDNRIHTDTLPSAPNPPIYTDTIIVDMCIDRSGTVVSTQINREKSVIRDSSSIEKSIRAARKYKFEPRPDGPELQCGKLQFVYKMRN